jgi:hypothetical protein
MKRIVGKSVKIILFAVLMAGIATALYAQKPTQTCSLSTLNGYYAMQGHGTVVQYPIGNPPFPLAEVARDFFDGAGKFMGRFVANGEGSRSATIVSSTHVTLRLAKLVSTSNAKHSRVYASITLNTRIVRPHATASCTKSSAHS